MPFRFRYIQFIIFILIFLSSISFGGIRLGGQLGLSSGPDQFVAGMRADIGTLIPGINILAIADLGVGENITLLSAGADLQYGFSLGGTVLPYFGIGMAAVWNVDGHDSNIGISIPAGIKFGGDYFFELRFGFEDSPDFKISLGMYF